MAWDIIEAWNKLAEKSTLTLHVNNASKWSVIRERVTSIPDVSIWETRGTVFHVLTLFDYQGHEFSRARVSEHWTRSFVSARRTDSHTHTHTHTHKEGRVDRYQSPRSSKRRCDATRRMLERHNQDRWKPSRSHLPLMIRFSDRWTDLILPRFNLPTLITLVEWRRSMPEFSPVETRAVWSNFVLFFFFFSFLFFFLVQSSLTN